MICVVVAIAALVLCGIWFRPALDQYRLREQGKLVRDGMPISDVLSRLGQPTQKEEFIEHNGDTEDHYYWTCGGSRLKVITKNNVVSHVEWENREQVPF